MELRAAKHKDALWGGVAKKIKHISYLYLYLYLYPLRTKRPYGYSTFAHPKSHFEFKAVPRREHWASIRKS